MADETATGPSENEGSTGGGGQTAPVRLYRSYFGDTADESRIYAGFGLFFTGLTLGIFGLLAFLYSGTQPVGSGSYWGLREAAIVMSLLALPAVVLSVPVLLSAGKRTLSVSIIGVGVCTVATGWLTQVYPYQWVGSSNDTLVIGGYAVGLVFLSASTGSTLVAQYVERATSQGGSQPSGPARPEAGGDSEETLGEEQVQADIEEAMSGSSLNWGGVEESGTTRRLNLDMPDDADVEASESASATETRAANDDVDEAVDSLQQLQGGEQETASTAGPDEQVEKLTALQQQQQETDDIETGVSDRGGILARLRRLLFD